MSAVTPQVTIIIPCYNYGRYVGEAVASALAQDAAPPFEVVVVDDGSTDETEEVLAGFTDPRLRVIRHPSNRGLLRTLETALGAAGGTFVARLDADDRLRPHFLRTTVPCFAGHPRTGVVWGDVALMDQRGGVTFPRAAGPHGREAFVGNEFLRLLERNVVPVPGMIARRECWLELLPIPPVDFVDDWYFTLNMARRWDFHYLPRVLADYRVHGANQHTSAARTGREEEAVRAILDAVFAVQEADPELDEAKRASRRMVYAGHAVQAGEKYFGFDDFGSARRCYLRALRLDPSSVLRGPVLRHLAGTLLGQRGYAAVKAAARRMSRKHGEAGR
ncbi:MAG: glycosyltransferase [Gemmatimonadota bacterium]